MSPPTSQVTYYYSDLQSTHTGHRHRDSGRQCVQTQEVRSSYAIFLSIYSYIVGSDHVPYRNSKLTRMLQPSLSGNARISVICTINPDINAIAESTSTLLFAKRIKNVQVGPLFIVVEILLT